jgi:hypothetical protein
VKYLLLKYIMIVCLFAYPLSIWGQGTTGLIEDDADYDKLSLMAHDGSKPVLPTKVNLKPYCPTPRNQGTIQSCVGWAIGYSAMTIEHAIKNKITDTKRITNSAFSALFIYNQIKISDNCNASSVPQALTLLEQKGNCLANEFDFDIENCRMLPDIRLRERAKNYVIEEHLRLFDRNATDIAKRDAIKRILAENKPVIIGLKINNQFKTLANKDTWNPTLGDTPTEAHAIVIVGYDDETEDFTLMNSWGIAWGNAGFIKVKYKHLLPNCLYAFAIQLKKSNSKPLVIAKKEPVEPISKPQNTPPSVSKPPVKEKLPKTDAPIVQAKKVEEPIARDLIELAGSFDINVYKGQNTWGENVFETAEVERIGNHYKLKKKDWQVGQFFQMVLTSEFSGAYVYVISLNPQKKAKVLFPKPKESALVMLDGARFVLPSPETAMRTEYAGTDRVCILFSLKKITNLDTVCRLIEETGADFEKYMYQLLNDNLMPISDTAFDNHKMAFSIQTRSNGSIIPIIVEFQSK